MALGLCGGALSFTGKYFTDFRIGLTRLLILLRGQIVSRPSFICDEFFVFLFKIYSGVLRWKHLREGMRVNRASEPAGLNMRCF